MFGRNGLKREIKALQDDLKVSGTKIADLRGQIVELTPRLRFRVDDVEVVAGSYQIEHGYNGEAYLVFHSGRYNKEVARFAKFVKVQEITDAKS